MVARKEQFYREVCGKGAQGQGRLRGKIFTICGICRSFLSCIAPISFAFLHCFYVSTIRKFLRVVVPLCHCGKSIFCGYRFDPESQLYYVRNRTYNPVLGRWLQRDPIGYAGGVNLYEYVNGRAVVDFDPSGRSECSDLLDEINEFRYDAAKKLAEASRIASELMRRPPQPWYERVYLKLEFTADIAEAMALQNHANFLEDIYKSTCNSTLPPLYPVPDTTPEVAPDIWPIPDIGPCLE